MDDTKIDESAQDQIEDIKPPIPDATSTGAEFSEDLGPEPFPPKELTAAIANRADNKNSQETPIVTEKEPKPTVSNEDNSDTVAEEPEEKPTPIVTTQSLPEAPLPVEDKKPPVSAISHNSSQDHGTHRTKTKTGNPGLASLIAFTGLALCVFVVFVYLQTN